ncbi:hypothetical protein A6A08_06990 [Nocardiopsis sp. TSRI0078]|uniref:Shedu immune nuclease family protein n=1 Tax=unclassified Nocardiopsis TaxID=2649073 RepID=UPI00093F56E3|nr:Shedu immune nuclease family protein [Nocardiopsis sp. TSRI0078]OKI17006.1 hypothetical protein A6A08_06990 [Nocardiopsis sp. TSRI0078]
MRVRADRTLYKLLDKIVELGCSGKTERLIDDAKNQMGHWSPFRGNRDLVELLEFVQANAVKERDEATSQRLTDAIGYALNTVNRNRLEAEYELYGGSLERELQSAQRVLSLGLQFAAVQIRENFDDLRRVSGDDVVAYLEQLHAGAQRMFPEPGRPGHYQVPRGRAEIAHRFGELLDKHITVVAETGTDGSEGISGLAREADSHAVFDGIEVQRRRDALALLRSTALNPHAVEADLQRALEKNPWIFGGRFVDFATRRLLAPSTEIDLPLLRPDGVLHVVEIKRANTKVVTHQRGRLIPSAEVHRAVEQIMNYFVSLDERREEIREKWGIDVRRCQATVVIGHPHHTEEDPRAVHETLRVYNSHLSRIDVVTYQELIDSAEHAVDFTRGALRLSDA